MELVRIKIVNGTEGRTTKIGTNTQGERMTGAKEAESERTGVGATGEEEEM